MCFIYSFFESTKIAFKSSSKNLFLKHLLLSLYVEEGSEDGFPELSLFSHHVDPRLSVLVASTLTRWDIGQAPNSLFIISFISRIITKYLCGYNNGETHVKIRKISNGKRKCTGRNLHHGYWFHTIYSHTFSKSPPHKTSAANL